MEPGSALTSALGQLLTSRAQSNLSAKRAKGAHRATHRGQGSLRLGARDQVQGLLNDSFAPIEERSFAHRDKGIKRSWE